MKKGSSYRGSAGGIPSKIGGGTTYKKAKSGGYGLRLQDPSRAKSTRSRSQKPLTPRTGGY